MALNGRPLVLEPFTTRYKLAEEEVLKPRQLEVAYIQQPFNPNTSKYLAPPLS